MHTFTVIARTFTVIVRMFTVINLAAGLDALDLVPDIAVYRRKHVLSDSVPGLGEITAGGQL